jgi:hypothetical protein
MGASPTKSAETASSNAIAMAAPRTGSVARSRVRNGKVRLSVALPTVRTVTRNAKANPMTRAVWASDSSPCAIPETIASIIRARTSSITAAAMMMRASLVASFPRSASTRAVTPTLVATMAVPTKSALGPDSPTTLISPQPRTKGSTTPPDGDRGSSPPNRPEVSHPRLEPNREEQ